MDASLSRSMAISRTRHPIRAAASEAGLGFIPFGVEAFDFALPRNIWFRRLFQDLLSRLQSGECRQVADLLGGYDFSHSGELIWGEE